MTKFMWVLLLATWGAAEGSTVISSIPVGGYTIDQPGRYVFSGDLTWDPAGDDAAIKITANDVTLDMKGYTLESLSSTYKTKGILATACSDLCIRNGTLLNMGLAGIDCELCTGVLIKRVNVDGLYVQDTVTYTVPTGILAYQCLDVAIDKCEVQNILVKTGSTAAIQLTETLASKITNCNVSNMLNLDGACTGIGHLLCDDAVVKDCSLNGLESQFIDNLNTEGHTAIGLVPVASTNLYIENCAISDITGCCDDAHGISVFICVGAVVKDCTVKDVVDGAGAALTGAKATGIEIYASDVEVTDCYVKNISAINPQDRQATGFSCALCSNVIFRGCKAENVNVFDENGNQSSCLGYGTGFGWAPDPRPDFIGAAEHILYKDCIAKNCQVGFDSWYHTDSVWDDIGSINNGIAVLNLNHSQRTLSCNPCSECGCLVTGCYPDPLTVTLDNIAANNTFKSVHAR